MARVQALEIYESIQKERKKAAALRRRISSQEYIAKKDRVTIEMKENIPERQVEQGLPEMFKGLHSTELVKLHVPKLRYKQRRLHVSEDPQFKQTWFKN
jgi:hypothetical protein